MKSRAITSTYKGISIWNGKGNNEIFIICLFPIAKREKKDKKKKKNKSNNFINFLIHSKSFLIFY